MSQPLPTMADSNDPATAAEAFEFMGFAESQSVESIHIDVAFIDHVRMVEFLIYARLQPYLKVAKCMIM